MIDPRETPDLLHQFQLSQSSSMRPNLWLFEAEPGVRNVVIFIGGELGWSVTELDSATEAWLQLREARREGGETGWPDFVIADLLADRECRQWLLAVREACPQIRMVCYSMLPLGETLKGELAQAHIEFRDKPQSLREVFALFQSCSR